MATYQVLYWQELPSQVKAEDPSGEHHIELPQRFQEEIDRVATERGAIGTDAYLDGWIWGDEIDRDGSAEEVAKAIAAEIETKFPEA